MDVRNCPKCGKIFTCVGRPICDECYKKEEDGFRELKNFLDDNPNCNLTEVSEATGVSPKRILRYIKEGRLQISKGLHGELKCETCGKPIVSGHYCDKCVISINSTVDELFKDHINKVDDKKGGRSSDASDAKQRTGKMHISKKKL